MIKSKPHARDVIDRGYVEHGYRLRTGVLPPETDGGPLSRCLLCPAVYEQMDLPVSGRLRLSTAEFEGSLRVIFSTVCGIRPQIGSVKVFCGSSQIFAGGAMFPSAIILVNKLLGKDILHPDATGQEYTLHMGLAPDRPGYRTPSRMVARWEVGGCGWQEPDCGDEPEWVDDVFWCDPQKGEDPVEGVASRLHAVFAGAGLPWLRHRLDAVLRETERPEGHCALVVCTRG